MLGFGLRSCRISEVLNWRHPLFVSMSFCRLHSLGSRPLHWTCIPREKYNGISRASAAGRSATGRERSQSSRPERDSEGDGSGMNPLWDSNVESVRRKSRNRSDGREPSSQSPSTPDWLTPKKEWTFNNSQENRKGEKKAEARDQLPWWKPKYDYDDGETEDEEGDDEDEEYGNTKTGQVFSSLRWGIPLSLVVLPWLLGNPVVLLLGLAALPAVQRAVGPSVRELWHSFLDVAESPSQKRRRKAEAYDSNSDESGDAYSSWGGERDNGQPYRYKKPASYDNSPAEPFPYSDVNRPVSRQGNQQAGQGVSMGDWEDLEADRRGRMPVRRTRRSSKLGWGSRKKEKPLFVRLLVALFPFLQNWGGWLFIFLFFPFLE